ncbi:DUF3791 domain-containing protein [Clostridium butyricum]
MRERIDFITYCLEEYKAAKKISGKEAIELFNRYEVIDYIRRYYEALHTTASQFIVNDIQQYISNRQ